MQHNVHINDANGSEAHTAHWSQENELNRSVVIRDKIVVSALDSEQNPND